MIPFLFPSLPTLATKLLPVAPTANDMTLWGMLVAGGWVMIPLLAASVASVTLIIYYFATLNQARVSTTPLKESLESMIREKNLAGLLETSRKSPQLLARVVEQAALFLQNHPEADLSMIREVAQSEGARQVSSLNQQVIYLMDIGVLAPMLGLFGTVVGILRSFGSIAGDSAAVSMRATLLAGGVSQALVATAVGLIIGISSMFFYSYFRGRTQALVSELETSATGLVAQMGLKLKKS